MQKLTLVILSLLSAATFLHAEEEPKLLTIHGEVKAHYRYSQDSRFLLQFPFPPDFIPRGQTQVFERTVSPGSSFEVSVASVILDVQPASTIMGRLRINFIDLYNRNPVSTDQTVDLKEAWLQFGRRSEFLQTGGGPFYVLFGKAPKFERQPERNLESYGLVSTAFNRFEDMQLQWGGDVASHVYWRAQISNGNPVFFRDPNALAGDNGNDDLRFPNPELHLNSGFPILYDAEVEDLSFQSRPEAGAGLGVRFESESREKGLDVFGFYYRRKLADHVDLRGTFYGGDLDLLDGTGGISLAIHGDKKIEYGANAEFRVSHLKVFSQTVHQELAGLKRTGFEVETAFRLSLPLRYAAGGKQLFTSLQPVFRFSILSNDFKGPSTFVAPSTFWDWKKFDFGLRMGIIQGADLTIEYARHRIRSAKPVDEDEFLTTLRYRF
jgi:hypothetical protein